IPPAHDALQQSASVEQWVPAMPQLPARQTPREELHVPAQHAASLLHGSPGAPHVAAESVVSEATATSLLASASPIVRSDATSPFDAASVMLRLEHASITNTASASNDARQTSFVSIEFLHDRRRCESARRCYIAVTATPPCSSSCRPRELLF